MKLFVLIFALLCLWLRLAMGVDEISFNASVTSNVVYRLRWATNSAGTVVGDMALGTNTVMALTNGPWGRFYFTVTALTTNGIESNPSNEVLSTNRPASPLQLRINEQTNVVILEGSFNGQHWKHLGIFTTNALQLALQKYQLIRAKVGPPPLP
jgi:hypothetical protein